MRTTQAAEKREFKLKPLSKDSVERALEKAETYRLLNQPRLAESICLDVLVIEPDNQKAAVFLLLALTDQFGQSSSAAAKRASDIAMKLKEEYARLYYTGIIRERLGSVSLGSGIPGSEFDAYEWYLEAMEFYEKADAANKDPRNDDPVLRWNTCARTIMQYSLHERPADDSGALLE